jgi:hypothetical protein
MTGGAGEGGGEDPGDTYLRLDGGNNNAPPNNYMRQSDSDARYLQLSGGTITGTLAVNDLLTAQGAVVGTTIESLEWPLNVNIPDGNDTRIWLGVRRYSAGGDHNSSQAIITRKVDATWGGGLSLSSSGNTLYYQFTSSGPYKPVSYVHLTASEVQVAISDRGFYTFRYDPRTEGNAPSVRNILIGTGPPSNAWGADGDIYIQHQV